MGVNKAVQTSTHLFYSSTASSFRSKKAVEMKVKLAIRLLISGPGTFPGPGQRKKERTI